MKKLTIYCIVFLLLPYWLPAQKQTNLHIITSFDNIPQYFPINCEINGQPYKFKAGQCMEIQLVTDSITIVLTDKRWVKRDEVHLHEAVQEEMFIRLFYGWQEGEKKSKIRLIAESICKSCYDELKKKCKSRLSS